MSGTPSVGRQRLTLAAPHVAEAVDDAQAERVGELAQEGDARVGGAARSVIFT